MATYQELRTRSQQVRDEQNIGGNTALRVGQLLMDIVKYFYDNDAAASEYLQQHFAMVNDGTQLLNWQQSPIVIPHTMGETYDEGDFSSLSQGENYYLAGFIMEANGQGGGINGETPKANVLYVNLANDTLYTWNGSSFDAITSGGGGGSISGDDIIKNAYYSNGNLVLIIETEGGDKTVTIPVNFDASNYVPTSRTVNGKRLNNNITLSQSDIPGLVAALAGKISGIKANGASTTLPVVDGIVELPPAGSTISPATAAPLEDGTAGVGSSDKYAREDHVHPHDSSKANTSDVYQKSQTYTKQEVDNAIAHASQGESIVTSLENVAIIDGFNSDTTLAGASARAIKEIYLNLYSLYQNLAGIAFTGTKPTWQTVSKPKYNITTSLTACTSSIQTGDAGSGKVYEGTVVVKLTPTTNYQMSSIAVTKNGNAVTFERANNQDGSVTITFVATGDVTITATAVDGYAIAVSGDHISASQTHSGNIYTVTLQVDTHYSLPDNIVVKHGNDVLTSGYTYTKAQGAVVIEGVTDNTYSIEVTVVEDAHATVSFASGVTNVVATHGGDTVTLPLKVYADMLVSNNYDIVFTPASGCKFTSNPSVGGSDLTNNTLTVTNTNVSNGASIEVSASARPLNTYNVTVPSDSHITVDNGTTGVSVPSTVQEDSALTIRLTPDTGYAISVGTKTMGSVALSDPTNNNGVLTFSIAAVTGHIVIAAVADEAGKYRVSWGDNVTMEDGQGNDLGSSITVDDDGTADFEGYIKPLFGYMITAVVVTMNGTTVQDAYDADTGIVTVENITGAVTITATVSFVNTAYSNVRYGYYSQKNNVGLVSVGANVPFTTSPLIDLGEGRTAATTIYFKSGSDSTCQLSLFNSKGVFIDSYRNTAETANVSVPTSIRYIRYTFKTSMLSSAKVYKAGDEANPLFDGSLFSVSNSDERYEIRTKDSFMLTPYAKKLTNDSYYNGASQVSDSPTYSAYTYSIPGNTLKVALNVVTRGFLDATDSAISTAFSGNVICLSKVFSLNGATSIKFFSNGSTSAEIRLYNGNTFADYFTAQSAVRILSSTQLKSATQAFMIFYSNNASNTYVEDSNGNLLWGNKS
ncbi:MAG: hypothetical protein IIZ44_00565 [Muribaculaceae bacterium]|nr:hypothetical protein [Muribaculaceae bacterium]